MKRREHIILILLCGAFLFAAGCTAASVGYIRYRDGVLYIEATNEGPATQAVLQVKIDQIKNFSQSEIFKKADFIDFASGTREYQVHIPLEPGRYKVYIYIIVDGDSKARVVRDLTIPG